MWGRGLRGNSAGCSALFHFQSLPPSPTSKLGPCGSDFWVGGFVYVLGSFGSFQRTLLWGWEFLLLPQPPQVFLVRCFEGSFPHAGTLGCVLCLGPQLFLLVYPHTNVGPPVLPATVLPALALQPLPCCKSSLFQLPSLPLLPVWMTVPSLTPWLSDIHTVRFSGRSGYFLFLNLLLSFWLCEEAKCIYLRLHLGQKSRKEKFIIWYSKTLGWIGQTDLWMVDPECGTLFLWAWNIQPLGFHLHGPWPGNKGSSIQLAQTEKSRGRILIGLTRLMCPCEAQSLWSGIEDWDYWPSSGPNQ